MVRIVATIVTTVLLFAGFALPAGAQPAYPARDITFVVPWAAGGSNDVLARALQPILQEQGIGTVIENVPGANGVIGMRRVALARPDGYTIGLNTSSTLAVVIQGKPALSLDQFTYLNRISVDPLLLVVPAKGQHATLEAFLAHMKSNPGKVSIATPGSNNVNHIFAAMTARGAGVGYVHVPYNGGAKVVGDLLGDHVQAGVLKPAETLPQIQDHLIKPLGVFASQRLDALPDVPTFKETGIDVFPFGNIVQMSYMVAPAGLPSDISDRLTKAFRAALQDPRFNAVAKQNAFLIDDLSGAALQKEVSDIGTALHTVGARVFTKEN